jgi:phosphopantetheine adenylyltransferase
VYSSALPRDAVGAAVLLPLSGLPPTRGHWQLLADGLFDLRRNNVGSSPLPIPLPVHIVVFEHPFKNGIRSRLAMERQDYELCLRESRVLQAHLSPDQRAAIVLSFSTGTVVNYCRQHQIGVILRGYRNRRDWCYEICLRCCWQCQAFVCRAGPLFCLLLRSRPQLCMSSSALRSQVATQSSNTSKLEQLSMDFDVPVTVLSKFLSHKA